MKNDKFLEILTNLITSGNKHIKKCITIKMINNNNIPQLVIRTSNDEDDLYILNLHISFITEILDDIYAFIDELLTENSKDEFKAIFVKTLYTIQTQTQKKLKKLKEKKKNGTNWDKNIKF